VLGPLDDPIGYARWRGGNIVARTQQFFRAPLRNLTNFWIRRRGQYANQRYFWTAGLLALAWKLPSIITTPIGLVVASSAIAAPIAAMLPKVGSKPYGPSGTTRSHPLGQEPLPPAYLVPRLPEKVRRALPPELWAPQDRSPRTRGVIPRETAQDLGLDPNLYPESFPERLAGLKTYKLPAHGGLRASGSRRRSGGDVRSGSTPESTQADFLFPDEQAEAAYEQRIGVWPGGAGPTAPLPGRRHAADDLRDDHALAR
jgi:hypothetical protein